MNSKNTIKMFTPQKIVIGLRFSGCSLDSLHELHVEAVNDKLYVERINFGWKNFED